MLCLPASRRGVSSVKTAASSYCLARGNPNQQRCLEYRKNSQHRNSEAQGAVFTFEAFNAIGKLFDLRALLVEVLIGSLQHRGAVEGADDGNFIFIPVAVQLADAAY